MGRFRSKKKRVYRPELLLQQLEERIVLDAAVNPAPQDNPTDHPANTQDHCGIPLRLPRMQPRQEEPAEATRTWLRNSLTATIMSSVKTSTWFSSRAIWPM